MPAISTGIHHSVFSEQLGRVQEGQNIIIINNLPLSRIFGELGWRIQMRQTRNIHPFERLVKCPGRLRRDATRNIE
jgi:hypothetical protein